MAGTWDDIGGLGTGTAPAAADPSIAQAVTTPAPAQAPIAAAVDPTTAVTQNYQTLFNRAPDEGGLSYWTQSGLTGQQLTDAMSAGARGADIGALYGINDADLSSNITTADIRNYVGQNMNDPYSIYSTAQQYNVNPETIAAVMGWSPEDTASFLNKYNTANTVSQQYQGIGRGLTGDAAIDSSGFNYWYNQLNSGAITPDQFNNAFINSAYQSVNQPGSTLPTGVSDKVYQQYFGLNPNALTDYTTATSQNVFGQNYAAPTGFNDFQTQLNNQLQSGQITVSEYNNQLQNSNYNRAQEASRLANIAKTVYGMTDAEAATLAKEVYSGNVPTSGLGSYYNQLLKDPNTAVSEILRQAANNPNAANSAYFQANPAALARYQDIGDSVEVRNGGMGGQYGYINGVPVLKASEIDNVFDLFGSDYVQGNAGGVDQATGWDTGSLNGLWARGAGALGIERTPVMSEGYQGAGAMPTGQYTYSGDIEGVARMLGIDPTQFKDVYETTEVPSWLGIQQKEVLVKSAQDQLYDAINNSTFKGIPVQDLLLARGKSGLGAGGLGENGQQAAFQDATENHAQVMYMRDDATGKYIPISQPQYFTGDMELHHGGFGGFAPILSMAMMAFAPELAAFYGGGTAGAIGAGATLGAGNAALGGGDILKGGLMGGLGGYLGSQTGFIGNEIGSALNISDPAIQNILARGAINLGMNIVGGAPLENALLNTGINTGLNLGMNQAGFQSTPMSNFATSVGVPLVMNGSINPMQVASAGLRTIQQTQPKPMKQGGLAYMKTGGKVKGGLPHFEDGGDVGSYDWGGFGDIGGASYPTIDYGGLDFGSMNFDSPAYDFGSSFNFDPASYDFGNFDPTAYDTTWSDITGNEFITPQGPEFLNTAYDESLPTESIDITGVGVNPDEGGVSAPETIETPNSTPIEPGSFDEQSTINVWDQPEPKFVVYNAQQYQNEDINDPLGRNSVIITDSSGATVGVIDADGKVVKGDLDVRVSENPNTGQVEYQYVDSNGHVVGGFDENGNWFNGYLTQSTAGSTDVITGDPGRYAGSNDPLGGTPVTNFGGQLADKADVDKLTMYNALIAGGMSPDQAMRAVSGPVGGGGGGGQRPQQPMGGGGVNMPGITNLTGSVTKANTGYNLSGMSQLPTSVNPMYKAAGGRINLPQFQSLNNYIDHNYDSNYAPQMAKGGQTQQRSGLDHVPEFYSEGGLNNRYVKGRGDGTSDEVPAMLANGEFVIPADVVSGLGNGSNDSGAKILDEFLKVIRRDKRAAHPSKLPADSKGPQAYLLQAKRKVRK